MLPKVSLLEELKKGGYEASLITTYNAYLPFYEEVVLRRLVNAGVRHNVLLMDSQQYGACLSSYPPRLAGRQYTLMPVTVTGAFHPKLIFLAGKQKGLVLIGSHNMTVAGFGFNRELTNVVRVQGAEDGAGVAVAQDVWSEIEWWLEHFARGVPHHVRDMVRRVRDFAPWLTSPAKPDPNLKFLAGRPGGMPLWDQLLALINGKVAQAFLEGPFFDRDLTFLERMKRDFPSAKLVVALDPDTAQIAPKAPRMKGISWVHAKALGTDENEAESTRYLHAKAILVQLKNGDVIVASGSANPSAPAWLADEASGNVELMLARRGEDADAAARALGLHDIPTFPPLSDADWRQIQQNSAEKTVAQAPAYRTGIAVVEGNRICFDATLIGGRRRVEVVLVDADGQELERTSGPSIEGDEGSVTCAASNLLEATGLHGIRAGKLIFKLALHHAQVIEEQSRTGAQRRFKEALLSLETDTPNIELLVQCIDKVIFSESRSAISALKPRTVAKHSATDDAPGPTTLAIDVGDIKKKKTKRRLTHSSDFAYLLDALIYHLRIQEDKSIEELDRFGRTEEEQIGTDDVLDGETEGATSEKQLELLSLCHRKVSTVVGRMIQQLDTFARGEQSAENVLIRLLGVLAVLRELRRCDGRVAWVEKGKTAVPEEQRLRLLEAVMFNFVERNPHQQQSSLLNLNPLGKEFEESDDIARLKGLLLWLAWDCGLTFSVNKPFNETREEQDERLRCNAMILALAQMVCTDEIVLDEARQSIGSVTANEMSWLSDIRRIAIRCATIRNDAGLRSAHEAEPGDIAVHRTVARWDLRIVESSDARRVSLIRLADGADPLVFRPEHLSVLRLTSGGN